MQWFQDPEYMVRGLMHLATRTYVYITVPGVHDCMYDCLTSRLYNYMRGSEAASNMESVFEKRCTVCTFVGINTASVFE